MTAASTDRSSRGEEDGARTLDGYGTENARFCTMTSRFREGTLKARLIFRLASAQDASVQNVAIISPFPFFLSPSAQCLVAVSGEESM